MMGTSHYIMVSSWDGIFIGNYGNPTEQYGNFMGHDGNFIDMMGSSQDIMGSSWDGIFIGYYGSFLGHNGNFM